MLDTLAFLLAHAESDAEKDLYTELTLTVPVRLTNLLPLLGYLMKPLVHALSAGPDQVNQGLRTLELCIDNLTADFLDPTMGPVLGDLMQALHRLLQPVPADRLHANAAVKILGKLGGRTRRFFEIEKTLSYQPPIDDVFVHLSFDGRGQKVSVAPLVKAAKLGVSSNMSAYHDDGLQVMISTVMTVLQEDGPFPEGNTTFQQAMSGLFLACALPGVKEKALEFVRNYCRRVFAAELTRYENRSESSKIIVDVGRKRHLPLTSAVSDCFVETLVDATPEQREILGEVLFTIVADFRALASTPAFSGRSDSSKAVDRTIQSFAHRFCSLCHEEKWARKMAGVSAIKRLVEKDSHRRFVVELQVDFARALLFCLRDAPKDAPRSAGDVIDLLKNIITTSQSQEDGRHKLPKLAETFVLELNSQSELSRTAAQNCLEHLGEVTGRTVSDLIASIAQAKLLDPNSGPIFSKPVRALPFAMQIGNIEALTYMVNLRPTFIESSEEFTRIVQEVLALADVDDQTLLTKPVTHKQEDWVKSLRISCLRLLRSAVASQDTLLKQTNLLPVRSR